jgi:glycolate oxidase iron-sulfur subunit
MTDTGTFAELAPLEPLMNACVHCGFCLTTCPSYRVLGNEAASPRGRIYMMRAGVERRLELVASVAAHFDSCLGCMACESACPSGVQYGPLIEETRAVIETHYRRPLMERVFRRLLFLVLPFPGRLRLLTPPRAVLRAIERRRGLMALLPAGVRSLVTLAAALPAATDRESIPVRTPAAGQRRLRVGLVTGCVQSAHFHHVNQATVRVLAAEGCEVMTPPVQGCCGALALHAGRADDARLHAKRLIDAFEDAGVDQIAVNAAGCGSTMKGYGALLARDPQWRDRALEFGSRVRDVSEILAGLDGPRAPRHAIKARIAYHDACHLAHAQRVREQPRQLLQGIPGVTIVPLPDADICCGSAGIFNLVQPDLAQELGARKAACVVEANADLVVTSNPGCLVQMTAATRAAGRPARVVHLVEVLDASIRNVELGGPWPSA